MAVKDWTKMLKKYKGEWVALANDEITVIAHDTSAKEVSKKAIELGHFEPILFKVPSKPERAYIGHTRHYECCTNL